MKLKKIKTIILRIICSILEHRYDIKLKDGKQCSRCKEMEGRPNLVMVDRPTFLNAINEIEKSNKELVEKIINLEKTIMSHGRVLQSLEVRMEKLDNLDLPTQSKQVKQIIKMLSGSNLEENSGDILDI